MKVVVLTTELNNDLLENTYNTFPLLIYFTYFV